MRRSAPGIRAIAGGVLVSSAMLGVLVAPGSADAPTDHYLVATEDIAAGTPLDGAPVRLAEMQVPPLVGEGAITSAAELDDATSRVAILRGSVITGSHLRHVPAGVPDGPEVTVTVPNGRALGGQVRVGDHVDVVATYGSGTDGFSLVVGANASVLDVASTDASLSAEAAVTITLRLATSDGGLPVIHGARSDSLTIVRALGRPVVDAAYTPERLSQVTP